MVGNPRGSMKRERIEPTETIYWFIFERLFADKKYEDAKYIWRAVKNSHVFAPSKVGAVSAFTRGVKSPTLQKPLCSGASRC